MGTIKEVFIMEDRATLTLEKIVAEMTTANRVAQQMSSSYGALSNMARPAASACEQLAGQVQRVGNNAKQSTSPLSEMAATAKRLVGAFVGIKTVTGLFNLSDTMTQTTARLDMMNDGLQDTAELNQMIYESAQRSRGAYQATADMVSKLGTLAGDAFNSSAEVVAFAEQLNKQITLSGASTQAADAAMLQLTQAMSSGVLRGEELNSVLEQTPTIAQTIADYMGVNIGTMRELASEGAISAEVVKNAMFNAAEETNRKFDQMPMTWSQVWTSFKNTATMAMQPVLNGVNSLANNIDTAAQFVVDNSELVEAALAGVAAGALVAGGIMLASAAQTAFAWAAANAPILAVAGGVALIIFMVRQAGATWEMIGSVIGGTVMLIYATIMNNLIVPGQRAFAAFANFVGNVFNDPVTAVKVLFYDMAMGILGHLRSVASGIQSLVNSIPGVEVSLTGAIDSLYNTLSANREAAIAAGSYTEYVKAWNYVDYSDALQFGHNAGGNIGSMLDNFDFSSAIQNLVGGISGSFDLSQFSQGATPYSPGGAMDDINGKLSDIAGSTSSIEKSVSMSQEDLKSLVDVAERKYVNQINLTSQSPVINITGQNTGNTYADLKHLEEAINNILIQEVAAGSTINTTTALF